MADKLASLITASLKPYAGWAALAFLIVALFSSFVARNFAVPLGFYAVALCFAVLRYWEQIRTFDFWALDEWLRTRRDAVGVSDWHAPHHAAEMFCNQVAVRTRNDAASEMNTIMMEIVRQTKGPYTGPLDFSRPVADHNTERNARYDAAQVRLNQTNSLLSRELHHYLVRGDLLAKGLLSDDGIARAERIIPTSRWRVMALDIVKAQAIGEGWKYSGVVIGVKPRKPAPPVPPQAGRAPEAARAPSGDPKAPAAVRPAAPPRPPKPSA